MADYIERMKVREILMDCGDIDAEATNYVLHDIDQLPSLAVPAQIVTGSIHQDHRVFFACECCTEENPEAALSHREDLAMMPDGTWLCHGCYDDCEKSAYGMTASDVDDFEFPRFDDMPRPPVFVPAVRAEGQPSEVLQEIADSGTADAFDEADFAILYREIPEANTTTLQEITNVPHDFCREIARRLRFPSPAEKPTLSAGWRRQDEIARIIDKHVRSEPDKNFIDRRWLVGVSEAAAEIAALVGSSQPETVSEDELTAFLRGRFVPCAPAEARAIISAFNVTRKNLEEPRG